MRNPVYDTLSTLVDIYTRCSDADLRLLAVEARCHMDQIVIDDLVEHATFAKDIYLDLPISTPHRIVFVVELLHCRGRGNNPPPTRLQCVVTEREVNIHGDAHGLSTEHIEEFFREAMFD